MARLNLLIPALVVVLSVLMSPVIGRPAGVPTYEEAPESSLDNELTVPASTMIGLVITNENQRQQTQPTTRRLSRRADGGFEEELLRQGFTTREELERLEAERRAWRTPETLDELISQLYGLRLRDKLTNYIQESSYTRAGTVVSVEEMNRFDNCMRLIGPKNFKNPLSEEERSQICIQYAKNPKANTIDIVRGVAMVRKAKDTQRKPKKQRKEDQDESVVDQIGQSARAAGDRIKNTGMSLLKPLDGGALGGLPKTPVNPIPRIMVP